jgi:hypothetical protein
MHRWICKHINYHDCLCRQHEHVQCLRCRPQLRWWERAARGVFMLRWVRESSHNYENLLNNNLTMFNDWLRPWICVRRECSAACVMQLCSGICKYFNNDTCVLGHFRYV